jgi:hypothetical protein
MQVIDHIFEVLGEATAIATATGDPVQTVHSWKANERIPPWRRKALLNLEPLEGKSLSPEALAYLKSKARRPEALGEQAAA